MTLNSKWIPMHWPCGLLPTASLEAKKKLTPELKDTLAAWTDPRSLDLLKDSPVNCLVIPWAEGSPNDQEHQKALEPLLRAGREHNLGFVGSIAGKQGVAASVAAGEQAGLAAVMVESLEGLPKDAPVILRNAKSGVPWESITPIFSLTDNLWPKLGLDEPKEGDAANAGPTGVPWVNSNGWMSLLARELSGGRTAWMEYDPPENSDLDHPAGYALAVADACAYGSKWVISLDPRLRHGLIQNDSRAAKVWESINSTLKFFGQNEAWQSFEPEGVLAVVSDFRGDNEFMSTEVLNLLARRLLQYRIMEKAKVSSSTLQGLKGVLWVDGSEPEAGTKTHLHTFINQGGLLIAPKLWWQISSKPEPGGLVGQYSVYHLGSGRVAVPAQEISDPYQIAVNAHLILSRRNDLVRIFNVTACNARVTRDPAKGKKLVQVLNYASTGESYVPSIWVRSGAPTGKFWMLGSATPAALQGIESHGGREYQLPFISTYAALEFS